MKLSLDSFNKMSETEAIAVLGRACGSRAWGEAVVNRRPFEEIEQLLACAHQRWAEASREEILEAFAHHPRIGADMAKLREKFASTANLSEGEQSGVSGASEQTLEALRNGNVRYEERYGHIFIVCASGKSAEQMLALLEARMDNDPEQELQIAAAEQGKITELRLRRMFSIFSSN